MRYFLLASLLLLFSCTDKKVSVPKESNDSSGIPSKEIDVTPEEVNVFSAMRPDERLNKGEQYTDEVEYVDYDANGDYALFTIKKGNEVVALQTNFEGSDQFSRGDILKITWKMDSTYIAGEGEKLDFTEWLINAEKVKDGSVSLFRKKYNKPLKYSWAEKEEYSKDFKDYLYTLVEYYLANSKKELVKAHLQNTDTEFVFSIEDRQKDGRAYTVLGIANELENHTSMIQWLYLDSETRKLYEYDLPNDKLIEFK
ncbi:MAG: hypothetical protein ABIP27_18680 [Flavobacterium circumlabens]|uniref:hypothetical protein n=1 Tax=Flavobacterium circumlabens TaxID=2133765 RepID=UPI003266D5BD